VKQFCYSTTIVRVRGRWVYGGKYFREGAKGRDFRGILGERVGTGEGTHFLARGKEELL
jgi:hypothetical protein